jgi:cell division protein FtsI (penicillin-binding protein 3)
MRTRRRRSTRRGPLPGRLRALAALALGAFGLLALRAMQLQTFDADRLRNLARGQVSTTVRLEVPRGAILDRDGQPLAVEAPVDSLAASPKRIAAAQRQRTAELLARALGKHSQTIYRALDPSKSFVWVERWISPEASERIAALDLEGIHLHRERRRYYPDGPLAAPFVGFAGRDGKGLTGLELRFDPQLSGREANVPALRDAAGRRLPLRDGRDAIEPGDDIQLALDKRLQHFALQALASAVEQRRAKRGTLVAMDPHTGEIMALAEVPSFDPNRFWEQDRKLFRASAFVDEFEPGSTLKPFTLAIALAAGVVTPDTLFDCENGRWRVRNRIIRDFKPHQILDVRGILRVSSNIGSAKIADLVGSKALVEGMRGFGFGQRTGSGFPGEASGQVRNIQEKQAVERANLAFGQGITVTAVQLASAASILANGGLRVTPRLRKLEPDVAAAPGERVMPERIARLVVGMMRDVVDSGTGKSAALPHHSVAGKTGTAQKVIDGTYSEHRYVATFFGIVPALNPRLVMVVVLDEPQGFHTGGVVAAPVFREVAGFAVEQLALPAEGAE